MGSHFLFQDRKYFFIELGSDKKCVAEILRSGAFGRGFCWGCLLFQLELYRVRIALQIAAAWFESPGKWIGIVIDNIKLMILIYQKYPEDSKPFIGHS